MYIYIYIIYMYIYTRETLQSFPRTSTYCPSLHRPMAIGRPILKYFTYIHFFEIFCNIFVNIFKYL